MKTKKEKKDFFSRLIFLVPIFVLIGVSLLKMGFAVDEIQEEVKPLYSYESLKDTDYKVNLKQNYFYESATLEANKEYASTSISTIEADFSYDFTQDNKNDITYVYNIVAEISAKPSNSDSTVDIWNRKFALLNNGMVTLKGEKGYSLSEHVSIDYDYFNRLARLYEQTYGFTIDATLKVKMNVKTIMDLTDINVGKKSLNEVVELDIPLNNTVTKVRKNYNQVTQEDIWPEKKEETKENSNNYVYIILGSICIAMGLGIVVVVIGRKNNNEEQSYHKNISYILKEYSDLIVTITNKPDLAKLKPMKISALEDLVDVAEQNSSNIIHYEKTKNKVSEFYVITNGYVYTFSVTANELKEKNK